MPSPRKPMDGDSAPEQFGLKGRAPSLPKHASPSKGLKDSSPEEFSGSKQVSAPKSAPKGKQLPPELNED